MRVWTLLSALAVAALAGFSRGFAAFGTAMIYVPLIALAYDAKTAVVTLFLVDLLPSLPLLWKAGPQCDRSNIAWMTLGAVAATPFGVALLLVADPTEAQLVLGLVLLAAVTYMVFRRGFQIVPGPAKAIAAGAVSGFAGGVSGIFGPPAMVYLLGRGADAKTARADTIVFLTGESLVLGATYLLYGMVTVETLELAFVLLPVYALATWYGARRFSTTGEAAYRKLMLGLLWGVSAFLVTRAALVLMEQ